MKKRKIIAVMITAGWFAGCRGNGEQRNYSALLENNAPDVSEIYAIAQNLEGRPIDEAIETEKKASMNAFSGIYFTTSRVDMFLNEDTDPARAQIVYSFVYIDGNNGIAKFGFIIFNYVWDSSQGSWIRKGYNVTLTDDFTGSICVKIVNGITNEPMNNVSLYATLIGNGTKYPFNTPVFKIADTTEYTCAHFLLAGKAKVFAFADGFEVAQTDWIDVKEGQEVKVPGAIQLLPISSNIALATIMGRLYFKDGITPVRSFILPDGSFVNPVVYLETDDGSSAFGLSTILPSENSINSKLEDGVFSISYITKGDYNIKVRAQNLDTFSLIDHTTKSIPISVDVDNNTGSKTINLGTLYLNNYPPDIIYIDGRFEVEPEEEVKFTALASDPNNDLLTYYWDTSGGFLKYVNSNEAIWVAPDKSGEYQISVMVNDSKAGYDITIVNVIVYGMNR